MHRQRTGKDGQAPRYVFGSAVVEVGARRLLIGGRERNLPRRVFDLLLILCRSPRQVIARETLYQALWPGGQIVSDEALTQTVFRLRSALGDEAERVVTLRGVGLRFDADVDVDVGSPATTAPAAPVLPPVPALPAAGATAVSPPAAVSGRNPVVVHPPRLRVVTLLLIVVAVATMGWQAWRHWSADPAAIIDPGYGLTVERTTAARRDTPGLLANAVRYDDSGDRPRARALLETVHEADHRTPWPALLTALWDIGAGDAMRAEDRLQEARRRIEPLDDPYIKAMLRYVEAELRVNPRDIIRYAGAVLDLEPGAWRLRLARAHLHNALGQRDAALREIQQIEVHQLGIRRLESALADRASFGDVDGAEARLRSLPRGTDAAAWEYLSGRIAWSRGDGHGARAAWERAVQEGRRNGRDDIVHRAQMNAGFAASLTGDFGNAIALLEAARIGSGQARRITDRLDLMLMLTQLHDLVGDPAAARLNFDALLAEFAEGGGPDMMRTQVVLVGARLFPALDTGLAPLPDPAAQALLDARHALALGDADTARSAYRLAEQLGALTGVLADEARLLAAQLDLPIAPERRFDPPYPPLSAALPRLLMPAANASQ